MTDAPRPPRRPGGGPGGPRSGPGRRPGPGAGGPGRGGPPGRGPGRGPGSGPPRPRREGPGRDGPRREGPGRDGPRREGPGRDGPRREGPGRDGPRRDGPYRDGPRRDGPYRDGPRRDGPPRDAPIFDGPRDDPNHDADDLRRALARLDGKPYPWYQDLVGRYAFPARGDRAGFMLHVDHVQGDPFAPPSRVRVMLVPRAAAFPERLWSAEPRRIGLACLLARRFAIAARGRARHRGGGGAHGPSGAIHIAMPGQQVMAQTAVAVRADGGVEARFTVALPGDGRRIDGRAASMLLLEDLPAIVDASLRGDASDLEAAWRAAATNEDADALRAAVATRGLVAFVADGSVLPRRSGVDDRPLEEGAVPFEAPESLAITLETPHGGPVRGMAIPAGVTLIVGGGYHGKSTLLRALELGVYNHRPGDGRERCVTVAEAVKVRAEDGRSVAGVDISGFIGALPGGVDTRAFSTPSASGSTSQAAAIVEALEMGATALLVDEDTAATNFMIRDRRMQALVPDALEPITPFVDRVRELHRDLGVSSVLVIGGSGDYLDVADTVVAMRDWRPVDVSAEAAEVARTLPTGRAARAAEPLRSPASRVPAAASIDASRGRHERSVRTRGTATIELGAETIDVGLLAQLVAPTQTRAIAAALAVIATEIADDARSVRALVEAVQRGVAARGLDALDDRLVGDLAAFRPFELAAALSRLRSLRLVTGPVRAGVGEDAPEEGAGAPEGDPAGAARAAGAEGGEDGDQT